MLNRLEIKSFRGIRNLTLEDLQDVNLFLGGNDAGKTTILEAVILGGVYKDINQILRCSRERLSSTPMSPFGPHYSTLDGFLSLFPFKEEEKRVALQMTIDGSPHSLELNGELSLHFQEAHGKEQEQEIRMFEGRHIVDGVSMPLFIPEDYHYKVSLQNQKNTYPIKAIWSGSHLSNRHRRRAYATKEGERNVVQLLHMIDRDIEGIKWQQAPFGNGFQEVIEHRQLGEVPLFAYGDGMKKALSLAEGVVTAKGGALLADEIETSLQTGLLSDIFGWLIEACQRNRVQLFATTHSLETISALARRAMETPNASLACYRLERPQDSDELRRVLEQYPDNEALLGLSQNGLDVRRFSAKELDEIVNGRGIDVRRQ